jgi:hypothetical protein
MNASATENAKQSFDALLSTLVGLGTTWAAYGLKIGKMALLHTADALGKTAHALETLAAELQKKAAPEAPKGDVVVDADARGTDQASPERPAAAA